MMKNAQNDNAVAYMPSFAWAESDDHARVLRDGQETNTCKLGIIVLDLAETMLIFGEN